MIAVEKSDIKENLIELGKKLVRELGLEQSTDTLARWMAHYIAQLIINAESAAPETKPQAEKECFQAILNLWEHRADFPAGKRPYEELEPILHQLLKLDTDANSAFYYRHIRPNEDEATENPEVTKWLEFVESINYAAKLTIGYGLSKAAESFTDKTREWVTLAEKIDLDQIEVKTVRLTSSISDFYNETNLDEIRRQTIQTKIARLSGIMSICELILADLKKMLNQSSIRPS